jgi:DNA invertase Pin-like site-specific DNA recombinase
MNSDNLLNKEYSSNFYGYIRTSDYIEASTGYSLKEQKRKLEDWCKDRNFNLIEIIQDDGVDVRDLDSLSNLNLLLNYLKEGDTIIITNLSRIARTLDLYLQICNIIIESNARLISLTENLVILDDETCTKAQKYVELVEIKMDQISETTKQEIKYVKQSDIITKLCYGQQQQYLLIDQKQKAERIIIESEEERKIIDVIVTLSSRVTEKGKPFTPHTIACKLNEFNIKPPGKSKKWYDMAVKRILERENKTIDNNDNKNKEENRVQ